MLAEFFIDRPKFAFVISIVITLVGAIAIYFLPVSEYPEIAPPQVVVSAQYPGANATDIEKTVAIPIESQINGVDGMIYMSSTSSNNGTYQLTVTFAVGTDPDIAAVNVQNRVALATPQLPQAVTQQGVTTKKQSSSMLLVVNLISPNGTHDDIFLSNYASINMQDALARIPGVGSVSQFGPLDYSMRIWINPDKLTALNLTPDDVSTSIQSQSLEASAGQIGAPPYDVPSQFQLTLQAKGRLESTREFEDIVIRANPDGSMVRLKDVARIELGSQSYAASSTLNDKPAASIAIYQASGANALDVADKVYAELAELEKSFPPDVQYKLLYDITKAVRESVEEIIKTLAMTGILVVAVTFLFLTNWRTTLIPAIAIPVSLIGTVAALYAIGFSANLITLFAIILAITLVVDDSIVITENVERIMEEDKLAPREATIKAMSQVTRPIIATTFVLLAVFVPVCFFPGITGEVYLQFALTITIAFTLSAVNALTLAPVLCVSLLKRAPGPPRGILALFPNFIERCRRAYVWVVEWLLRHLALAGVLFVLFFAATVYMVWKVPTGFVPLEDKGVLLVNVQLPDGASLERTDKVTAQMSTLIREMPGVSDVISVTGYSIIAGAGSNYALLIPVLTPWSERTSSDMQWFRILQRMDEKLATAPDADAFVLPLPPIDGLGLSGGITGQVQDYRDRPIDSLAAATRALVVAANERPEFVRLFTTLSAGAPQYVVEIDRAKAESLGVPVSGIFSALKATLGSAYVNTFNLYEKLYWVIIAADAPYRDSLDDVARIQVRSNQGSMIPLGALVELKSTVGPEAVNRYNLVRTANIQGMTATGYSTGQAIAVVEDIARRVLPEGYGVEWTGMSLQEVQATGLMVYIFLLAFIFAYLFLVAQYESWALPVAVMLSAVFAVFGAMLPLWIISLLNNNLYAQIGIVLLIGLAAKKAIMLVEFSRVRREQGDSILEAAMSSARTRFRPVTMTGLCFIIGVLPLVLATGAGASSRISIGVVVFSGMLFDSIVGLFYIPLLYYVFQTMRERTRAKESPRKRPVLAK
ncbi:MAG: multidrug efflux RND transporter permease subunit [Pseudomonadota bacterium]|nr:multidrug efflux RND transporter permease subunit [Pseudomonadota bacterium]